jgi:hypothetical protein
MSSVPMSFAFPDVEPLRPDLVVKTSYGNDSVALIQWLKEYEEKHGIGCLGKVVCLFNDTKWAAGWWMERVDNLEEKIVRSYGFIPSRTSCIGMRPLIKKRNTWPNEHRRFCTEVLKIQPTKEWLAVHDVDGIAEMVCGVRREESQARRLWPEYVPASEKNEGRAEWAPIVDVLVAERDALIHRAGLEPLAHRSRECRCVLANATDLKTWREEDIAEIEAEEAILKAQSVPPYTNCFMFRPRHKKGNPEGIRAVVEWAKQVKTKEPPTGGCDSGFCVS